MSGSNSSYPAAKPGALDQPLVDTAIEHADMLLFDLALRAELEQPIEVATIFVRVVSLDHGAFEPSPERLQFLDHGWPGRYNRSFGRASIGFGGATRSFGAPR